MEIKIVQERTYQQMINKVMLLKERFEQCNPARIRGLEDWLSSQEVCNELKISQRTLQTMRTNGTINFSQIGSKYYYHRDGVKKLIGSKIVKR